MRVSALKEDIPTPFDLYIAAEADFDATLRFPNLTDTTLSEAGAIADAATVGQQLTSLRETLGDDLPTSESAQSIAALISAGADALEILRERFEEWQDEVEDSIAAEGNIFEAINRLVGDWKTNVDTKLDDLDYISDLFPSWAQQSDYSFPAMQVGDWAFVASSERVGGLPMGGPSYYHWIRIPKFPTTSGNYMLTVDASGSYPTYTWTAQ